MLTHTICVVSAAKASDNSRKYVSAVPAKCSTSGAIVQLRDDVRQPLAATYEKLVAFGAIKNYTFNDLR